MTKQNINQSDEKLKSLSISTMSTTTMRSSVKGDGNEKPESDITKKDSKMKIRLDRESLVLWRRPFTTVFYFVCELNCIFKERLCSLLLNRYFYFTIIAAIISHIAIGMHSDTSWEKLILWYSWWVGLGVLSSVGLGTGLHTFILYLGPHIASVTMAAYECGTTNFPEPPYPDEITCPEDNGGHQASVTVWQIMSKVRLESFCWGVGTALGELPPYFVARAHRMSGHADEDDSDDEGDELEELERIAKQDPSKLTIYEKMKVSVEGLVKRVGFFGILACASIPNPLFDIAGMTCGHFLIPFWTFFTATLIGKAVIKMHIQMLFVVFAFNEALLEYALSHLGFMSNYLETPLRRVLNEQRQKLHKTSSNGQDGQHEENYASKTGGGVNWISFIFEKFVISMILYFLVSIVNSLAQSYHKRRSVIKQQKKME